MKNRIYLNHITTTTQKQWLAGAEHKDLHRLVISVSGYEARSIHWVSTTLRILPKSEIMQHLVVGFRKFNDRLSRPKNDNFYKENNISMEQLPSDNWDDFEQVIQTEIDRVKEKAEKQQIEVHIDYSCMPRSWYCRLPFLIEKQLRPQDVAYFWYSPGEYPATDYPTAGVEDFHIFAGKAKLNPNFRTHMFGLGFDRIRSQAIWSVIDPENLVCFYTDPGTVDGYVKKVKQDNRDILLSANYIFSVPMEDFVNTYSRLVGVVREFSNVGDVILVPDGPKPLVLASSLIPSFLGIPGVVCFHVTRRKANESEPVEVKPAGEPYGFCFQGLSSE